MGNHSKICRDLGANVGKYEAASFPNGKPEESLRILKNIKRKL